MKQLSSRLPACLNERGQTSSALLSLALVPMSAIGALVLVVCWISVQKGAVGTPSAIYTLGKYLDVFSAPFVLRVAANTITFTITATAIALLFGLPIAWLADRTDLPGKTLIYAIMT